VFDERVNFFVVVIGVVVEENELFDAGLQCEGNGIVHATMAPPDVPLVFSPVVLGIQDEDVSIADEINHFEVIAARARFNIREKNDDSIGRKQPVADGDAGMIGALGADEDMADGKVEIHQFFDLDVAGQLGERHGEIGAFHLPGKCSHEACAGTFAT